MEVFVPIRLSRIIFVFFLVVFGPAVALGAGFFLPNQSVKATARGNAWVATADSAAAAYYNPAGLVQLERPSLETGLYAIQLGNKVTIGGVEYRAESKWQAVPHFYYAHPISDDLTVGFALNGPFGLGTEWGDNTPFRDVTTNAELTNIRASAVAGYRVNETLSIGGGLSLNYADATLRQGLTPFNPLAPANDFLEFEGDDLAFSWIVGVLWQPHEQHSFGFVYRSQVDYDLRGSLKGSAGFGLPLGSASLEIPTPASAAVGYAYKPTERLTIEANVEWINWDELDAITIGALPTVPFDWESTFIYEIGATYKINDSFEVSIGYDYNEGSQPDLFYNPAVADADRHWLNAGMTYRIGDYTWQLAYQYGFSNNEVTGSGPGFETDGSYEADHHAVLVSGQFDF